MAPTPVRHPFADARRAAARRRAIAAHPAGRGRRPVGAATVPVPVATEPPRGRPGHHDEDGSMTTEYGLIVVVGATACSLVIEWASGGAVFDLLGSVLTAAKGLVGL